MFTRLLDPLCFNCIQIRLNRIKGGRTGVGGIDVNSRRVFMVTHNKARFRVPIKTQTGHLAGSILNDRKLIFQTLVGLGSSFEKTKNRIWCRFIIHFQRSSSWFSHIVTASAGCKMQGIAKITLHWYWWFSRISKLQWFRISRIQTKNLIIRAYIFKNAFTLLLPCVE